jgi:hypothetical protein
VFKRYKPETDVFREAAIITARPDRHKLIRLACSSLSDGSDQFQPLEGAKGGRLDLLYQLAVESRSVGNFRAADTAVQLESAEPVLWVSWLAWAVTF